MNKLTTAKQAQTTKNQAPTVEELAEQLRRAKIEMEKKKILHYNKRATYDEMAEAAKIVAKLMFEYQKVKMPTRRPQRVPYQALLR